MPANHTLGAVVLDAGMIWSDEFDWRPVEASQEYGVTGALIIDTATRLAGRPITLEGADDHGWITRTTLASLVGLAASPTDTFTFTHADGRTFTVMFAPGAEPIAARPIARPERPPAEWPYVVTLRLIEV